MLSWIAQGRTGYSKRDLTQEGLHRAQRHGLAVQQGRGGSLEDQFSALNALILVTLK